MSPFIYGQKGKLHLLDLVKSRKYFKRVLIFLVRAAARGQSILFIGTSPITSVAVSRAARRCRSFYVTEKWLGGMLTNWETLQGSTETLRRLEREQRQGRLRRRPKKELARALREKQKLQKNLGGVKTMTRLPNIAVIVGQNEELNALEECNRVGLRHITLLDTNNDPSRADLFIPANDDSLTSVNLILDALVTAIRDGQSIRRQRMKRRVGRRIRTSPGSSGSTRKQGREARPARPRRASAGPRPSTPRDAKTAPARVTLLQPPVRPDVGDAPGSEAPRPGVTRSERSERSKD